MKKKKLEFVIIGCGNVAWHLAKKISSSKSNQVYVYNHTENANLQAFKNKLNCTVFPDLKNIQTTADFYFICVSDKAISSVAKKISILNPNGIVMHTSGSQSIQKLGTKNKQTAVFYPLQTFSKKDKIKWSDIPIVIEANQTSTLLGLELLAKSFSKKVVALSFQERLQLHLAAVLVNNFTNALFIEAYKFLPKQNESNFNLLLPLMKQTVSKLEKVHPLNAQTGPAKRKDNLVMEKHLLLIEDNNLLKHIYKLMSELIQLQQKNTI